MLPLRDRPPPNATESEWPPQSITPLRIAKRDTQQRQHGSQLSRRSSNTFAKLTRSNLVSQSPFRSQPSTPSRPSSLTNAPSPRRVSGEKRPRPDSMQSHVENERPLGFKRRQSKGFQDLVEREPVTKSPFRLPATAADDPFPPAPPPTKILRTSHLPTPSSSASPGRPSLVSKRLHGPRLIGHDVSKRQRRKTVTFDETCDVVTFERDDSLEEELFSDDNNDDYDEAEDYEEPVGGIEANDSITGLVDTMIQDARGTSSPQTPSMDRSLPFSMDNEDGVPYGRTHHTDRVAHSRQSHPTPPLDTPEVLTSITSQSPSLTSTPPRSQSVGSTMPLGRSTHVERARADRMPDDVEEDIQMLPPSPSPAKNKRYPFGDRSESLVPKFDLDAHRQNVADSAGVEPADPFSLPDREDDREDVQIVELSFMSSEGASGLLPETKVAPRQASEVAGIEKELGLGTPNSQVRTSTPPLRLKSPGSSFGKTIESPSPRELPRLPRGRSESPLAIHAVSPTGLPSGLAYLDSPSFRSTSGSPAFTSPARVESPLSRNLESMPSTGSLTGPSGTGSISRRNPRIDREDIHKRLLLKRNIDSPVPEEIGETSTIADPLTNVDATDISIQSEGAPLGLLQTSVPPPPPLHREGTYDGVMSIDPDPQPADPPRPSMLVRAQSEIETNSTRSTSTIGFQGLKLDFSDDSPSLDLSLNASASGSTRVEIDEVKSALERLVQNVATDSASASSSAHPSPQNLKMKGSRASLKLATVSKGVKVKRYEPLSDLDTTMEEEEPLDEHADHQHATPSHSTTSSSAQRTPELLSGGGFMSPSLSRNTSESSNMVQPIPKDAIRHREQMILEKRREMRRREQDEDLGYVTPPRNPPHPVGRPSARRSMSTGDAEDLQAAARLAALNPPGSSVLPDVVVTEEKDPLAESIARELRKLRGSTKSRYHVRQHSETIYASSDADKVSHIDGAGDVDNGRAWRTVRRPSDMNEYAKQIREYRTQEKSGKSHGKVFVRVLHVKSLNVPFPQQTTVMTCTLNNGIHFVTTPECNLEKKCQIEQEFELIEHSKLEFTLTLKVRRDPHIVAQFKANSPAPVPPVPAPPASKGGMRSFFSSPKKPARVVQPLPVAPPVIEENLARYLKPDGTLARAFVSFKDIASRCDTRLFETSYPLIGQRMESGSKAVSLEIGELVLQLFRLPPLPGIPQSQLPQSLEECHRGLRHVHWHKMTYFEGTLTQNGGDCTTWRRRQFRVIGANLVAFNDVTKRATVTIDLRKAIAVEDIPDPRDRILTPSSAQTSTSSFDEYEGLYGVERSFRLRFQRGLEILFFTDTDEEKERWLEVLHALIGRIPPNPLWAELLWQRQQESAQHPPMP
ncbi:hypothetical protein F5148DRAFT_1300050 [Russula earlei]|uniref:Uncharacterized protein n=1 Tax=Russula earlei TaxID=71964 RepID=A0ACC0U538_9AGAM|nr:hypothetical protein F5148DRAFT_1300050 [Russula earlei]